MIATKPANVWTNSAGQAVPTRYVPTRDKRATRLVARHIKAAGAMATRLAALRQAVLNDVEDFVAWSAEASGIKAAALYDDPNYFVKRQALWLMIAVVMSALACKIDYHRWRPLALVSLVAAVGLLTLVVIPGIGSKIGGSRRWFHLGILSFQPSELAKFSLVLILAWWMARENGMCVNSGGARVVPLAMLGLVVGLIFIEPDFGTALLCGVVGLAILYAGGTRTAYLAAFAAMGFSGFVVAVMRDPVRMNRIMAF